MDAGKLLRGHYESRGAESNFISRHPGDASGQIGFNLSLTTNFIEVFLHKMMLKISSQIITINMKYKLRALEEI